MTAVLSPTQEGRRLIGYYAHYHGQGHAHRASAIAKRLDLPVHLLTSRIAEACQALPGFDDVVDLECDIDDVPVEGRSRAEDVDCFHYAPLWTKGCRRRVAQLTDWIEKQNPALLVVDVSVEVTLLARLASLPTVVVRQHGRRDDPAHRMAYQSAECLLAPFPPELEDDITPDWVCEKTFYTPAFCRHPLAMRESEAPPVDEVAAGSTRRGPRCVAMVGRGGTGVDVAALNAAAAATPEWDWIALGPVETAAAGSAPSNIRYLGWIADPLRYLRAADVVLSAAGHNSVMEIGYARRPMIAFAEPRPFEEQLRKAHILAREGLAVPLETWPVPDAWPALLDRARQLDPRGWDRMYHADGAAWAAEGIRQVALTGRRAVPLGPDGYRTFGASQSDRPARLGHAIPERGEVMPV